MHDSASLFSIPYYIVNSTTGLVNLFATHRKTTTAKLYHRSRNTGTNARARACREMHSVCTKHTCRQTHMHATCIICRTTGSGTHEIPGAVRARRECSGGVEITRCMKCIGWQQHQQQHTELIATHARCDVHFV